MKYLLWLIPLAIVVAVIYPVFAQGNIHDRRTPCISNLKQLGTGIQIYMTDWNDRFPLRDTWMDATGIYTKRPDIYHSPALQSPRENPDIYGYCFNAKLSGAEVSYPVDTVPMVFDSVNLARNASGGIDSLPSPSRHKEGNHVGFVDTHVRTVKPQ
jgi:hypothetical protein